MKKIIAIVLVMVLALSVAAFAGPRGTGEGPRGGRDITELLEAVGITQEEFDAAREEGKMLHEILDADQLEALKEYRLAQLEERLNAMVEAGRITEEQKAERLAEAEERIESGEFGPRGGRGDGERMGKKGKGGKGPEGKGKGAGKFGEGRTKRDFSEVFELLGITAEEAREARVEGKMLHEIAEEKGLTEEFNALMLESLEERLTALVEAGKITEEDKAEKLAAAEERMANGEYGRDGDKTRLGDGIRRAKGGRRGFDGSGMKGTRRGPVTETE